MRKFFQRLDNSSSQRGEYQRETLVGGPSITSGPNNGSIGPNSYSSGGPFIGKTFTLGQYHCVVEDVIAEGGFALVFLVKAQSSFGRFALKRLHVNNEQDLANCKREIEIAKKLGSHKNIVQLVESHINYCGNGVYEILMLWQYCKSQLLQFLNDRLRSENNGCNETEIIKIMCDLCEAIARMHQSDPPIIHRDLKVENVLISEGGIHLLCDFGSATTNVLTLDPSNSTASALAIEEEIKRFTTLAYRSPEMVDVYSARPITTKSDIWALGCLLYKICFFTLPFGESTLAIQNASLTIPDYASEKYSSKLLSLIGYMLKPDPDERPDIYQVSSLVFQLANQKCPVPNLTVTKVVHVPAWAELSVPPTETEARELRKTSNTSQSQPISVSANTNDQVDNRTTTTTSVTPRQRPKAIININSVLPTSPLPFNQHQRAVTPNDMPSSAVSSLNPQSNLPTSTSFNSNLLCRLPNDGGNGEDDVDWSKKQDRLQKQQKHESASNSSLNNSSTTDLSVSRNPFLGTTTSVEVNETTIKSEQLQQSRRHSQTPPGSSNNNQGIITTSHHHRRNQSDTSAFTGSLNRIEKFSKNNTQPPLSSSQYISTRGRSLNPFEDAPDDYSYEDQLFGHEFDKIRQENLISNNVLINDTDLDPFEAAPFDAERLKQFIERQKSNDSTSADAVSLTESSNFKPKPYLINVTSSEISNTASVEVTNQRQFQLTNSQSTVITIRSNNDFIIQNSSIDNSKHPKSATSSISASESSAFISVGSLASTTTAPPSVSICGVNQKAQLNNITGVNANQSISSSSQGQSTFGPSTNYMPLYSSDTAEDSDESSSSSESEVQSIDELVVDAHKTKINDDLISGDMLSTNETDLTKPLVADDENEDDGDEEYHDDQEEDDENEDDGSSIGSASDLAISVDSSDESDAYNDDINSSSSCSIPSNSLKSLNPDKSRINEIIINEKNDLDDRNGFEYVNYEGGSTFHLTGNSWNISENCDIILNKTMTNHIQDTEGKNISRIQITNVNQDGMTETMTELDGSSFSEVSSIISKNLANESNSTSIDHLIGHIEGHRPLLEEEDDVEEVEDSQNVKPFIEIDKEVEYSKCSVNDVTLSQQKVPFSTNFNSSSNIFTKSSAQPVVDTYSDFETLSLQQIVDETEENRLLDKEVEQNLVSQVIYDQLTNKDLFGSIPFTDKCIINKPTNEHDKSTTTIKNSSSLFSQTNDNKAKFENSFTDVPISKLEKAANPIQIQPAVQKISVQNSNLTNINSSIKNIETTKTVETKINSTSLTTFVKPTDLFGAIPFASSTDPNGKKVNDKSILPTTCVKQQTTYTIDLPIQVINLKPVNHLPFSNSVAPTKTNSNPSLSNAKISTSIVSNISLITTTSVTKPDSKLISIMATLPSTTTIQTGKPLLQKSNSKLKSKVAKKYEVDESDDEVDGLLDPNDDDPEQLMDSTANKKKEKKKDKKVKEKRPVKERSEKEKSKEEKKKIKEEDVKKSKPEKELKKEKDKEIKKSKEKEKLEKKASEKEKKMKKDVKAKKIEPDIDSKKPDSKALTQLKPNSKNISKDLKSSKESKTKSKHQAFANMSFEDETHQHQQQQETNHALSNNNAITITRC